MVKNTLQTVKLGDVSTIVTGNTPSKAVDDYWINGNIPFITPSQLHDKVAPVGDADSYVTHEALKKGKILPKNAVLVSCIGTLGKLAIAQEPIVTNQQINAVVFDENRVQFRYGAYALLTVRSQMVKRSASTTVTIINKTAFSNVEIPLPPLETQKKIAAALDQAQELIDKRQQQIELLDEFLQSVFLDMFGDPVRNPKGYPIVALEELGKWRSGGTPPRKNPSYFKGSIPWFSSGELNQLYINNSVEYITHNAIQETSAKLVEEGSLLLGMYDTAALKSSINEVPCSCNQAIAFSKLDEKKVETVYVYHLLQLGRDHYRSQQRGVRQKNLNLSMIKALEILSPPICEQRYFARIVEKTEVQKAKMLEGKLFMNTMFQSIMQKAFRGELFM